MNHFDLISDLHLDFWLKRTARGTKEQQREHQKEIDAFVSSLLPRTVSEVLVIAGDLGHSNEMNFEVLQSLKHVYPYIVLVAGNHDYYLVGQTQLQTQARYHTS